MRIAARRRGSARSAARTFTGVRSRQIWPGEARFINAIATAQPPQGERVPPEGALHDDAPVDAPLAEFGGHAGIGSNALAFGSDATHTGSALLLGNPHWFWTGPDRFYQAQLTIPGKLNVSGVSFLGMPVILIGFNDNDAPRSTALYVQRNGERIALFGGCDAGRYFTSACAAHPFDASGYSMNVKPTGDTYLQIVSFSGDQVLARTLLAPSESDDPASAHYADGTRDYAVQRWTIIPFSEEAIAHDPALTVRTVSSSDSEGKAQ